MRKIIFTILIALLCTSCRDFLSEKSDLQLSTPDVLADNQALLDNYGFMNTEFASAGENSADNYYLTDADFNLIYNEELKRQITWMPDNVNMPSSEGNDWMATYQAIYISNAVLFNITEKNLKGVKVDNVRGQALALRALRYLDAAQIWCPVYNSSTAEKDLGLPLRLDPDFNVPSVRSSVAKTYEQIIGDLNSSIPLLEAKQITPMRISKAAAYGILARTYLFMGNYEGALKNSLAALSLNSTLMNYNAINSNMEYPFPEMNQEVLLWSAMRYESHFFPAKIPNDIYRSYDENDLRKSCFFTINSSSEVVFKGFYNNSNGSLTSVGVDELYLMAAECYAKLNQVGLAMDYLNKLLVTRWKTGSYVNKTASTKDEALAIIKQERRKELLLRGLRWPDLKRYNRDGANITLTRTIGGKTYVLPPNDPRYAIAIPEDIIRMTGMPQNPR